VPVAGDDRPCGGEGERGAPPGLISHIAKMLREGKESLIGEWTSRVRRDPAIPQAHTLEEEALRDNIPRLIDALVDSLAQSAKRGEPRGATAQEIGDQSAVRTHAQHRMEEGYTLAEELREMSHLRCALGDMCTRSGLILEGEEAKLVHAVIDETMTAAALEMEKLSSADLRRDVALRELFTAILGHDLRSPLTGIVLASSKLLARDDLPERVSKDHRRIAANAARMQRLIEDLLDMTRIRAGGLPITRRPTDLRPICEDVIEEALLVHLRCILELIAPAEVCGNWDPDRLTQLAQNLVHNAIEHGQHNAPIRIELRDQGASVELEVHNVGAPIVPEVLPAIFDPFIQGEPAARRSKGLGLGLFIAKAIAEGHGGTIRATSDAEHGTSFIAALPRSA
jgi:signal transduction histidine kinase